MPTSVAPKNIHPEENQKPTDRVTQIAFYVMMGAMIAALLYFLALPIFM